MTNGAGKLRSLLNFQQRSAEDDGYGSSGNTGPFQTVFSDSAEMTPRMGSEAVMASRLQGVQPYTIRIRSHTVARTVDATWRAVDARTGAVYAIVSPAANVDQKNAYLDILATVGSNAQ
jgi:head-tail adaptor